MKINGIYLGDCLDLMSNIPGKSIDMILADLPYGTTACTWDSIIPLEPLWKHYKRIIKDRGAIVLTGSQPFTSKLVMSNLEWFKYCWYWRKTKPNGWQHAQNRPMRAIEEICIFSDAPMGHKSQLGNTRKIYNPQGIKSVGTKKVASVAHGRTMGARPNQIGKEYTAYTGFPCDVLEFSNVVGEQAIHPTQKPVALFSYLIRTYTNPGDLVLDNVCGSGTTAISAIETGCNWLLIEKDPEYYQVAKQRIDRRLQQPFLPGIAPQSNGKEEQLNLFEPAA